MTECARFNSCSAPFCPVIPSSLQGAWFPDDPVCTTRRDDFITRQRRIARRAGSRDRFYTLAMISHPCQVRRGTKGLDPELTAERIPAAAAEWIERHPPARIMAPEERAALSTRISRQKSGLTGRFCGVREEGGTSTPLEMEAMK